MERMTDPPLRPGDILPLTHTTRVQCAQLIVVRVIRVDDRATYPG